MTSQLGDPPAEPLIRVWWEFFTDRLSTYFQCYSMDNPCWERRIDTVLNLAWRYSRGSAHQYSFFALRYLAWAHEVAPDAVSSLEYAFVAVFADLHHVV